MQQRTKFLFHLFILLHFRRKPFVISTNDLPVLDTPIRDNFATMPPEDVSPFQQR